MAKITSNTMYILQSLEDNERPTGYNLELAIKTVQIKNNLNPSVQCFEENTKEEFLIALEDIAAIAEHITPILHIECHGSQDGFHLASGETVAWGEMKERIRAINLACNNNLFIGVSACEGANLLALYEINKPCPFFGYAGTLRQPPPKELEEAYTAFYTSLFTDKDFIKAKHAMQAAVGEFADTYKVINCQEYFIQVVRSSYSHVMDPEKRLRIMTNCSIKHRDKFPTLDDDQFIAEMDKYLQEDFATKNIRNWQRVFLHEDRNPTIPL